LPPQGVKAFLSPSRGYFKTGPSGPGFLFVRQRTSQILSLQSTIARNLSLKISGNAIKKLKEEEVEDLFDSPYLVLTAKSNISVIQFLTKPIKAIEKCSKISSQAAKGIPITENDSRDWGPPPSRN